jgi:hypothetical protein
VRTVLILALVCFACAGLNDDQMEADSAKAADSIKLRFARTKEAATRDLAAREAIEKAKRDSVALVARARADSERVALGLPSMAQLSTMVPRLSPARMPEIPERVRAVLGARGCLVPQYFNGERRNAYGGAFSAKGAAEWAVMCSVNGNSQILIIASLTGAVVDSVALGGDAEAMDQTDGKWGFTRTFSVFRLGPREIDDYSKSIPQPVDHDALDIPIFGKASVAHYLARGKWYHVITSD